jgi:hypothetical protein
MARKPAPDVWTIPKRGSVGGQWWTDDVLDACEDRLDRGRLSRGATYARAGRVFDVTVGPGYVDAFVMGSRRRPYETSLIWKPWSGDGLQRLERSLARHREVLAALLAGEMPEAFADLVHEAGLSLAPEIQRKSSYWSRLDWEFSCTCLDYGNPCKHGAALLLAFIYRCNSEPGLLLRLRGLEPQQVMLHPLTTSGPALPRGSFYRAGGGLSGITMEVTRPANPAGILAKLGPLSLQVGDRMVISALIEAYDILSAVAVVRSRDLLGGAE